MAKSMKDKIQERIDELVTEMKQAMQLYNDKDQEITQLNQELSDRIRELKGLLAREEKEAK